MKKYAYALSTLIVIAIIAACTSKTASGTMTSTPTAAASKDMVTPAGKRKFIDAANMNTTVRPQDDFYEYANGTWLAKTEIPATESRWGSFNELREFNQNALKGICEELAAKPGEKGSLSQKVGDFYATGMNLDAIEKGGITPLKPYLARIDAVKNFAGLLDEIALEYTEGTNSIFGLGVGIDAKNSSVYATSIGAGGLQFARPRFVFEGRPAFAKNSQSL